MKRIIFEVLWGLARHVSDYDEPEESRRARVMDYAEDIDEAAKGNRRIMAALITTIEYESHMARWVADGCKGKGPKGAGNCDAGTSRSIFQVKSKNCKAGASHPRGSREAQKEFAKCAAKLWNSAYFRCQGTRPDNVLAGAYSGYWMMCRGLPSAEARAGFHTSIVAKLYQPCAGSESGKGCKRKKKKKS